MRGCRLTLCFALVFAGAKGLADEKSGAGSKPVPTTASEVTSPRDPASGLATGKRMHKPLLLQEEGFELVDGRYFILDKTTGNIRFGDGVDGKRPPEGAVLDATYRTGAGRTLVVRSGKLVDVPTPAPTPGTAKKDAAKMTIKVSPEYTRMKTGSGEVATPPPAPK